MGQSAPKPPPVSWDATRPTVSLLGIDQVALETRLVSKLPKDSFAAHPLVFFLRVKSVSIVSQQMSLGAAALVFFVLQGDVVLNATLRMDADLNCSSVFGLQMGASASHRAVFATMNILVRQEVPVFMTKELGPLFA